MCQHNAQVAEKLQQIQVIRNSRIIYKCLLVLLLLHTLDANLNYTFLLQIMKHWLLLNIFFYTCSEPATFHASSLTHSMNIPESSAAGFLGRPEGK